MVYFKILKRYIYLKLILGYVPKKSTNQLFKSLDIILKGQLTDSLTIGQCATINGIFTSSVSRLKGDKKKCVEFFLEVIGICSRVEKISKEIFVTRSNAFKYYANLIAPHVIGMEQVKKAILCQLVGGTPKNIRGSYIRGNIHILLIGDPGVAKSQILQFVQKIIPNSFFVSGPSSSAAGLSAAVTQSKGQFVVNYGITVLANKGIVCIDEYDKMIEDHRPAIKEAMDHQTISIAKASNCATMKAECAVLAAANNLLLHDVDESKPKSQLTSGFDIVLELTDTPHAESDHKLGNHIIDLHNNKCQLNENENVTLLWNFVKACRFGYIPNLECPDAITKLRDTYSFWRKNYNNANVSHLVSLIRVSEAIARINRTDVSLDCVEEAIKLVNLEKRKNF